jgi:hypothetical protein
MDCIAKGEEEKRKELWQSRPGSVAEVQRLYHFQSYFCVFCAFSRPFPIPGSVQPELSRLPNEFPPAPVQASNRIKTGNFCRVQCAARGFLERVHGSIILGLLSVLDLVRFPLTAR